MSALTAVPITRGHGGKTSSAALNPQYHAYDHDPATTVPLAATNGRPITLASPVSSTDTLSLSPPATPLPAVKELNSHRDPLAPNKTPVPQRSLITSVMPSPSVHSNSANQQRPPDTSLMEDLEANDDQDIPMEHPLKRHSTDHSISNYLIKNSTSKEGGGGGSLGRHNTTGHALAAARSKQHQQRQVSISEEFEKELSARRKAFRRLSRRRKDDGDDDDRVLIGTRISEGHQNYVLMYNMLTGIRIAVGRVSAKMGRKLVPEDFSAAHKLAFDV